MYSNTLDITCAVFSAVYNMEILEVSTLGDSFDLCFRASCLGYSAQSPRGFRSCFWVTVYSPLVWRVSGGLLILPLLPGMTGVIKFLDRTACDCNRCHWKFCPCLLFLLSCDEKGLLGSLEQDNQIKVI